MYVVIWQYKVKQGYREAFEALYGNEGDWVQWFRKSPSFVSTDLLHSESDPQIYVTLDRWSSKEAYDQYYGSGGRHFDELDARGDEMTEEEIRIGGFSAVG